MYAPSAPRVHPPRPHPPGPDTAFPPQLNLGTFEALRRDIRPGVQRRKVGKEGAILRPDGSSGASFRLFEEKPLFANESGGTFPSPKKASTVARAGREGATMYPDGTPVAAGRNAKTTNPSRAPTPSPEHRLNAPLRSISREAREGCFEQLTSPGVQPPLAERRVGPPVLPLTGARSESSLSFNMIARTSVARARRVRGALVCGGRKCSAHNTENTPQSQLRNDDSGSELVRFQIQTWIAALQTDTIPACNPPMGKMEFRSTASLPVSVSILRGRAADVARRLRPPRPPQRPAPPGRNHRVPPLPLPPPPAGKENVNGGENVDCPSPFP